MDEIKVDAKLDITDLECPMTFIRTLFAMEELEDGQVLEIRLNSGEPVENMPRSLKDEGYCILRTAGNGDGTYTILVEKSPPGARG